MVVNLPVISCHLFLSVSHSASTLSGKQSLFTKNQSGDRFKSQNKGFFRSHIRYFMCVFLLSLLLRHKNDCFLSDQTRSQGRLRRIDLPWRRMRVEKKRAKHETNLDSREEEAITTKFSFVWMLLKSLLLTRSVFLFLYNRFWHQFPLTSIWRFCPKDEISSPFKKKKEIGITPFVENRMKGEAKEDMEEQQREDDRD